MNKLLIITGPTAVGKSALAINLANHFKSSVISCDSMQIYKEMNIGTAKPDAEHMGGINHYLMDFVSPDCPYSAAEYAKDFDKTLKQNFANKVPIVCGGTGLYINAILFNFQYSNALFDLQLRNQLEGEAQKFGNQYIHDKLKAIDPESAAFLHFNDVKRVIRAIEIFRLTGVKKSDSQNDYLQKPKYEYKLYGLNIDRAILYDRINQRVDIMMRQGLLEEVQKLLADGYDEKLQSMQAIGYKELIDYIKGNVALDEAVNQIKQYSRNYAKRQITFMKKIPQIKWFNAFDKDLQEKIIQDYLA